MPGFTHPDIPPTPIDKGKGRVVEQLAPPSSSVSGNIGSSSGPVRQNIGGVQVETRYVQWYIMPIKYNPI